MSMLVSDQSTCVDTCQIWHTLTRVLCLFATLSSTSTVSLCFHFHRLYLLTKASPSMACASRMSPPRRLQNPQPSPHHRPQNPQPSPSCRLQNPQSSPCHHPQKPQQSSHHPPQKPQQRSCHPPQSPQQSPQQSLEDSVDELSFVSMHSNRSRNFLQRLENSTLGSKTHLRLEALLDTIEERERRERRRKLNRKCFSHT